MARNGTPGNLREKFGLPERYPAKAIPRVIFKHRGPNRRPAVNHKNKGRKRRPEPRANPEHFGFCLSVTVMIDAGALPQEGGRVDARASVTQQQMADRCAIRRESFTRRLSALAPEVPSSKRKKIQPPVHECIDRQRMFGAANEYSFLGGLAEKRVKGWAVEDSAGETTREFYSRAVAYRHLREMVKLHGPGSHRVMERDLPAEEYYYPTQQEITTNPLLSAVWDKSGWDGFKRVPGWVWEPRLAICWWRVMAPDGQEVKRYPLERLARRYVAWVQSDRHLQECEHKTRCGAQWAAALTVEQDTSEHEIWKIISPRGQEIARYTSEEKARGRVATMARYWPDVASRVTIRLDSMRGTPVTDATRLVLTHYFLCGLQDFGVVRPYQATVAADTGLSVKEVYNCNCELEALGLIRVAHPEMEMTEDGPRRGPATIVYLPMRTLTSEEAAAERDRLLAAVATRQASRQLSMAQILHEQLLSAWQDKEHSIGAFWNEFARQAIAKGINRSLVHQLVPRPPD